MTVVTALQAALAAEYATVYGYGVVGARLTGADQGYATTALEAHMVTRDRLIGLVSALGATPVAALPAYRLPFAVTDTASAKQLAAQLEQGCAGAAWDLIAASAPSTSLRSLGISWIADAAVRATHWGGTQALPGQPA